MLGMTPFQNSKRSCGSRTVPRAPRWPQKCSRLLAAGLIGEAEWCMRAAAGFTALAVGLLSLSLSGPGQTAKAAPPTASGTLNAPPPEARVDINHASLAELLKVPGLTQSWAARIVRFRPYRTKLDLLDRGVLSGEVYDRIKDFVIAHREENQSPKPARKREGDGPKPVPFLQFHNSE